MADQGPEQPGFESRAAGLLSGFALVTSPLRPQVSFRGSEVSHC